MSIIMPVNTIPETIQFPELLCRVNAMRDNYPHDIIDPYFSIIECLVDVINNLNHRVTELEKKEEQDDDE